MSLEIIFPNENIMKIEDLVNLKMHFLELINDKNLSVSSELPKLNNYFGQLEGYLIVADRKNLSEYFSCFNKCNYLDLLNELFELKDKNIRLNILKMLYFLSSNIQNNEFFEYLYSTKFPVKLYHMPGLKMNLIDKLISIDSQVEEVLTYQINFIKSLTLKININSLKYFYDSDINQFPILTKALSLYNYSDSLVKNVAQNIFLALIGINDKNLRQFMAGFPINLYYSNTIFELKNKIINLCSIDFNEENFKKNCIIMFKYHDIINDKLLFLSDLLDFNIENINYIVINCLLNEIIFPLMYSIINYKDKETIMIYHSLYIICLILYTIKNEFIYNIINYFLFKEKISKSLYEKIVSTKFDLINENIMKKINLLITKSQYADVNDNNWKNISVMMKKRNGIDLSSGEIDFENIYDYIKNFMNNNTENINNPIFDNMKMFFMSNDDKMILILNLIVNSYIKFYTDKNEKEKMNENIQNLLNNTLFKIDLTSDDSDNIINYLFNYLNSSKIFRIATNEMILYNMQILVKIYLEQNENNEEFKNSLLKKLIDLVQKQISRMKDLIEDDETTNKYLLDSSLKAYEYYVKNIEKKINDLVSLSNILIPMKYIDKNENSPMQLKEDQLSHDILKNYLIKIFYIYDTIYDLIENENYLIKKNKFPIEIETFKLQLGKEYSLEELGEDCYHCNIIKDNDNPIKSEAILSDDCLYFGEILSKNFDDLSKIKIFKKIQLRYLELKKGKDNCIIDIFDKTNPETYKNVIKMNCINEHNTNVMHNYVLQKKLQCLLLEQNVFNSFIDTINNRLEEIDIE